MEEKTPQETIHWHTYEHAIHKSGSLVYIHPAIRTLYAKMRVAEQTVKVVEGRYFSSDDPWAQRMIDQDRHYSTFVCVKFEGQIWSVEEEYVIAVP